MEFSVSSTEKQSRASKKLIPWHFQQRYQTSLSQQSMNHSIRTSGYKQKIKSLLKNNKNLARALEHCKNSKENLSEKNDQNKDIIDISRIKLKEISDNLRKVTAEVDETFNLLQSQVEPKSLKSYQGQIMPRTTFKKTLKAVSKFEVLQEVSEDGETEQNLSENIKLNTKSKQVQQNKSMPKEKKSSAKTANAKKNISNVPKTKKQGLKGKHALSSKLVAVRTSKPLVDETPPSYLLGISSDSESFQKLVEQCKTASKNRKNVHIKTKARDKIGLEQCAEDSVLNSGFILDDLKETRKSITSAQKKKVDKITGDRACSNTKTRKNSIVNKNVIISPENEPQSSSTDSWTTTDHSTGDDKNKPILKNNNDVLKTPTLNFKPQVPAIKSLKVVPNSLESNRTVNPKVCLEQSDFIQSSALIQKQTVSLNEIFQETKSVPKITIKLNNKKKKNNVPPKKVGFRLEEESDKIEEAIDPISTLKINKPQKRPLKESTQNIAAPPSKKKARASSAPKASSDKEINTFVVTAEVHMPPDGYIPDEAQFEDKTCFFKKQPTVVLRDIFGSMHQKNVILEKVCGNSDKSGNVLPPIDEESSEAHSSNSDGSEHFNVQCNKENKNCGHSLLEDRKNYRRQRSVIPSYKEVKLNTKMRRS